MTPEISVYEVVVPGEPCPWTVYTRRGEPSPGFVAMQAWQESIRAAIIEKYGRPMLTGPLELEVVFWRRLPKPWPKRMTAQRRMKAATKRPDRTNYLKALEDALNGVLIVDDSQVVSGSTSKATAAPSEAPYTWFKLTVLEAQE